MKKYNQILILAVFAILSMLIVLPAKADVGTIQLLSAGTVTNNTTRTTGFTDAVVDNQKNDEASLQVSFTGDQAGTGAVTLILARSADGTTFETTPRISIATAVNGVTAVCLYTNLPNTGAAYAYRLISIQNADASASITNCTVSIVKKRQR